MHMHTRRPNRPQLSTAHGWCLTPQDEQNLARYQGALHRATTYLSATAQKRVDVALEVAYQVSVKLAKQVSRLFWSEYVNATRNECTILRLITVFFI